MSDQRTPVTICWHCDRPLDAAADFGPSEDLEVEPGAVSLCMYCGAVAVFGPDLKLLRPTKEFLDDLGDDQEFRKSYVQFTWARQYVMLRQSLMRDEGDPDR